MDELKRQRESAKLHTPTEHAFTQSLLKCVKLRKNGKESPFPHIDSLRIEEQGRAIGSLPILGTDIHELPESIIRELVTASVSLLAEESRNHGAQLLHLDAIPAAFCISSLPVKGYVGENITTKALRAWKEVCLSADQSDPHVVDALGKWFDLIGQDGYLCNPAVFLQIQAECYQNDKIDLRVRSRMLGVLECG